jgi:hypothetical protein
VALIFSDLKEWSDKWHAAIEGDSKMLESVTLNRWLAEGEKIGLDKGLETGELIGKIEFAQRALPLKVTARKELGSRLEVLEASAFPDS